MARVQFKMPDEYMEKLSKAGKKIDEISIKAINSGAEIVKSEIQKSLHSVIGKDTKHESKSTGELEHSLGISKPMQDRNGSYNVKVGFSEPRSDGKSNAMIANVIEYGKSGQAPKPFLAPARRKSKKPCENRMQEVIKEELDKL